MMAGYTIVDVRYRPNDLCRRLAEIGWSARIELTSGGMFYWGRAKEAS